MLGTKRLLLVDYAKRLASEGLAVGTSGNLSVRVDDLIAITPSGADYDAMHPDDICIVNIEGEVIDGSNPSSELLMHLAIYESSNASAVVHTHPTYATAVSLLPIEELPPIHYLIELLGGPVRLAHYARYGSQELADNVLTALQGRNAVILRNHGATTLGQSLNAAFRNSIYLEWLCQIYCLAKQMGTPQRLSEGQLAEAAKHLSTYGS